ncbi:MAG: DUF4367 domain-containing protein [Anaerostipes sp.]|uniref:DUF4367 domain-containing protein n=1 Tax=Anaerostipes sp. TaxID=1872530 RepID=UPI003992789C
MSDQDKKIVGEQEKLLDHIIEYGGRQYIDDEIKKCEDIPELEPSKEFDEKMNRMFKDAYKKEARKENMRFGKKIAVILLAVVGVGSAAAMNIQAVREPVLNFVFNQTGKDNKSTVSIETKSKKKTNFILKYIPDGYKQTKKTFSDTQRQFAYEFYNQTDSKYIYIKIQLNEKYENYTKIINNSYSEITKNSRSYYFISGNKNRLLWYHNKNIFSIISSLSEDEMIKIAENIKISQ